MIPASFICMVFPIFDTPTFKTLGDSHERGARSLGHWRRDPNTPSLLHKNRRIFRACAGEKSQNERKQHAKRQGKPANCPIDGRRTAGAVGSPPADSHTAGAAGSPPADSTHRRSSWKPSGGQHTAGAVGSPPADRPPPEQLEALRRWTQHADSPAPRGSSPQCAI